MDFIYFGFVLFLFGLAVFDLVVGVSNDAVNFMNSAIGSKAAKFRTVIIIAAIGVFCGASMSNGMMEIARHGIFRPEQFYFEELMYIFLGVMITDIILLDIFNSLGMPTSTTVSMVFELLGGTFVLALMKLVGDETGILEMSHLLNTEKAFSVIIGIFTSVAIAFFFGALVQYITRLLFSFSFNRNLKYKIGVFGGLCATAIIYFMLIKGVKDLAFMTPEIKAFIKENTWAIVGGCFVVFTVLMQILHLCKVNVFKVIVMLGTFSLATAFAGNDLVNFIGVPLAGWSSYQDYIANGNGEPGTFLMSSLNEPARTPLVFLLIAGVIMVVSLATSKKAKNVIKTSVDLSRQDEGEEIFGSSRMARSIVRSSSQIARFVLRITPESARRWCNSRFNKDEIIISEGAAFDLVRASVNLVLAGLLVALGTSLKLPLSTTYVTFMVAMGTSLADRAWGRESAVFRITGVLSVIGGWFITAAVAFILCAILVLAMYFGGNIMAVILVVVAIIVLVRNNVKYEENKSDSAHKNEWQTVLDASNYEEVWKSLSVYVEHHLAEHLANGMNLYKQLTDGFFHEDFRRLRRADHKLNNLKVDFKKQRHLEMVALRRIDRDQAIKKNTWYHLGSNSTQQLLNCLRRICEPCREHVENSFAPLPNSYFEEFLPLRNRVISYFEQANQLLIEKRYVDAETLRMEGVTLQKDFSKMRKKQIDRMQDKNNNLAASYIYLNLLQESQELVGSVRHMLRAARNFQSNEVVNESHNEF